MTRLQTPPATVAFFYARGGGPTALPVPPASACGRARRRARRLPRWTRFALGCLSAQAAEKRTERLYALGRARVLAVAEFVPGLSMVTVLRPGHVAPRGPSHTAALRV
ncbi:hypothetical protein ACP93_13405 [Xanthomonas sp. NCPPB 1128]|nr:hypothetical protein ACP93_13405 [Xanthomonas sp. NCPPB 1128]